MEKKTNKEALQELSDKMGANQFAKVSCECCSCGKKFDISLERTAEDSISIDGGVIGVLYGDINCMCLDCKSAGRSFGNNCEIYSRVVGYLRPVSNWNDAKKQEFKQRTPYKPVKE